MRARVAAHELEVGIPQGFLVPLDDIVDYYGHGVDVGVAQVLGPFPRDLAIPFNSVVETARVRPIVPSSA